MWLDVLPHRGDPRGLVGPVSGVLQLAGPHERLGEDFLQGRALRPLSWAAASGAEIQAGGCRRGSSIQEGKGAEEDPRTRT